MESNARTIRMRRRPLLQTCAVSMTQISGKASKMIKDYDEPIGLMLNKTLILASTTRIFIYMMHIQWLTVLAFIDDRILMAEQKIETLFPPSSHVFDKMDNLVQSIEWLPRKLDDATDKLQSALEKYPFMEWALIHGVSWLNLMVSILFTSEQTSSRERDIMIDINCDENESRTTTTTTTENHVVVEYSPPGPRCEQNESSPTTTESGITTKCTYKEILEKGKSEKLEKNKYCSEMKNIEEDMISSDDPILELFESGWHMKPAKGGMPSSASLD